MPEYEIKLNKKKEAYLRKVAEINIDDSDLTVDSAVTVVGIMRKYFNVGELFEERAYALYLNIRKQLVGITVIGVKELFIRAILIRASAIIVVHNHPSGVVLPSKRDISVTENLRKGCEILELELLDHVIVSDEAYFSFDEMKLL